MIGQVVETVAALPPAQVTVVVLLVALVSAVVVEKVVVVATRRFVARTESTFDDVVFEELRFPVLLTIFLAAVYLLTRLPAAETGALDRQTLDLFFGRPSLSVIILAWAWALNQLVNRVVDEVDEVGRYEFAPVLSNVWTLVVVLGAAVGLLSLWEIDVTPLVGAAGVAGIAVGFAARDTVANFFGGLALYFDDTYALGDYVELDDGTAGTVVKMGVRSTTLLTRGEVLVTVPNAMLNAGKVVNQSAPKRRKRVELPVGVGYDTDLDAFEALALEVAAVEDLILADPAPRIRFRGFGDSALQYDLLCWVASPDHEGRAVHELGRALYARLLATGVEVPYPKRDLTVRDGTPSANEDASPDLSRSGG
jgi:small-conductance mechanosensitive channel